MESFIVEKARKVKNKDTVISSFSTTISHISGCRTRFRLVQAAVYVFQLRSLPVYSWPYGDVLSVGAGSCVPSAPPPSGGPLRHLAAESRQVPVREERLGQRPHPAAQHIRREKNRKTGSRSRAILKHKSFPFKWPFLEAVPAMTSLMLIRAPMDH